MSLNVVGSGFGRTGTMSMKLALEQLGQGRCHHMEEVFENPWQAPFWAAALRNEQVDWDMLLNGYGATMDWPSGHFWRDLLAANPDAKVIHTTRSAESWWASYSETIMKFLEVAVDDPANQGVGREMSEWCVTAFGRTFGADYRDREGGLRSFERRLAEVQEAVPADRLLVYPVGSGWEPLCEFLEVPVPKEEFPRSNDRSEFWENFSPDAE
ncbi:sulfotransferase family protein [Shimia abyssi]|uniref:Sulfotransferase family protein n=1 Tax=Shimia abyssi TaxID=1662395 RepID=A0A2P8FG32_9RHOB|nr:sulfotransferase family protein [Shimia abyssi]PSL20670.1 hypothetical protein CLV88_103318 [Shimia abyssi]